MPYTTPNGCVYDSGDYARCLDLALELVGPRRRRGAPARGRRGAREAARVGHRVDARLGDEQLRAVAAPQPRAPVLGQQRGRLGQARHLRRGRRHARDDAAGPGARDDRLAGRGGHHRLRPRRRERARRARQLLELARGLLGHVREPVRRHRAGRGQGRRRPARRPDAAPRRDRPRHDPGRRSVVEESLAKRADNPEAALPFMALGAIVNANNAGLPPETEDITMNCRFVYRPPFEVPDMERKFGNLTLTYATQIHACVVEIDRETGEVRGRRLRGRRRLRHAHQPEDRRGSGARRHGARHRRSAVGESTPTTRTGTC